MTDHLRKHFRRCPMIKGVKWCFFQHQMCETPINSSHKPQGDRGFSQWKRNFPVLLFSRLPGCPHSMFSFNNPLHHQTSWPSSSNHQTSVSQCLPLSHVTGPTHRRPTRSGNTVRERLYLVVFPNRKMVIPTFAIFKAYGLILVLSSYIALGNSKTWGELINNDLTRRKLSKMLALKQP